MTIANYSRKRHRFAINYTSVALLHFLLVSLTCGRQFMCTFRARILLFRSFFFAFVQFVVFFLWCTFLHNIWVVCLLNTLNYCWADVAGVFVSAVASAFLKTEGQKTGFMIFDWILMESWISKFTKIIHVWAIWFILSMNILRFENTNWVCW